jgi:hypothetical protein
MAGLAAGSTRSRMTHLRHRHPGHAHSTKDAPPASGEEGLIVALGPEAVDGETWIER